jgi:hypothetical protein
MPVFLERNHIMFTARRSEGATQTAARDIAHDIIPVTSGPTLKSGIPIMTIYRDCFPSSTPKDHDPIRRLPNISGRLCHRCPICYS